MIITLTGLPRSGTAFASMLFQLHPKCIAYHELAMYDKDWRKTLRMAQLMYDYVANCTTYGFLDNAQVVSHRKVCLSVHPEKSRRRAEIACQKEIPKDFAHYLTGSLYEWLDKNTDVLIMAQDDIFTVSGCKKVWQHCFDEDFPELKVRQLVKQNIQHHNPHIVFGKDVVLEL